MERGSRVRRGGRGLSLSTLLTALAALASPGTGGTAVPAEARDCALWVSSDPAGARVYVDGELRGKTPLKLEQLPAGDHRLKVVKEGYLENRRVLKLRAGQAASVQIRLTGIAADGRRAFQVEPEETQEKKKGSKLKWILPAAAAAGAGAFLLLRGGNEPPTPGVILLSPPTPALLAVTRVTFTAQGATDPNGDALTYTWAFGDGETGSGQSITHVYRGEGTFNVVLTVSDGKAQATAATTATVHSLNGAWSFINTPVVYQVSQAGATMTGQGSNGNRFTATLSDPRNISMSHTWIGCPEAPRNFTGTVDEPLNGMQLNAVQCPGTLTLMVLRRK